MEAGIPEPIFQKEGIFTVILYLTSKSSGKSSGKTSEKTSEKASEKASGKTSEKVLKLINQNGQITIEELSGKLQKTIRAIEMHIKKLKDQ